MPVNICRIHSTILQNSSARQRLQRQLSSCSLQRDSQQLTALIFLEVQCKQPLTSAALWKPSWAAMTTMRDRLPAHSLLPGHSLQAPAQRNSSLQQRQQCQL